MPMDLDDDSGFNQFWDDTISAFRKEAIDDHLDGGNLDAVNDHVIGPVDSTTLAAQYAMPVVWSVPTGHSPAYATTATDQGTLSMRVVTFAKDQHQPTAFKKARVLGGRIVDNVEGSALVVDGRANASKVELDDFQTDSRPVSGQGAALKFAELAFSIEVERKYV